MKRALMLWKEGAITISAVQEARGSRCSIKLKAKENKSTGKKTTNYAAFSGTHWKNDTNRFLKSVMTLSAEDMEAITDLAKTAAQSVTKADGRTSAMNLDDDDDDEDVILCNGSESSEDEVEVAAHVPRWKSHRTFTFYCITWYLTSFSSYQSNDIGDPPLICMKREFVIRTSIRGTTPTNGTIPPHILGDLKLN